MEAVKLSSNSLFKMHKNEVCSFNNEFQIPVIFHQGQSKHCNHFETCIPSIALRGQNPFSAGKN